jgi:hypothetical protein
MGLDDLYEVPKVADSYAALFWRDYKVNDRPGQEVCVAGLVGMVVLADILKPVEPVMEDNWSRFHHAKVESATLEERGFARFTAMDLKKKRREQDRKESEEECPESQFRQVSQRAHCSSSESHAPPLRSWTGDSGFRTDDRFHIPYFPSI